MKEMPNWLKEYKKRAKLMDILVAAFEEEDCCKVVEMLREWAQELDQSFTQALPELPGEKKSKKKRR